MIKDNLVRVLETSIRDNWDLPCFTDYGSDFSLSFAQVAENILRIHEMFKSFGVEKGEK